MSVEQAEKKEGNRFFAIHLGVKKKKRWFDYCKSQGKKPGTLINELIDDHLLKYGDFVPHEPSVMDSTLLEAMSQIPPKRLVSEGYEEGQKCRVEIRLTPSEKACLDALAEREKCSMQYWIIHVIRGVMSRQVQMGGKELDALGESNYQLLSIGRNLNQIARHLNQTQGESYQPTLDEILGLRAYIIRHAKRVSQLMRSCLERWSLS